MILDKQKQTGYSGWRSPSNIALVKYWGKFGNQLPQNPSISFTLSKAHTETIIRYAVNESNTSGPHLDFYFEGKRNEAFKQRIESYIHKNIEEFPHLKQLGLSIESKNSFPHSSGIASSASSMSALVLCLCTIEDRMQEKESSIEDFMKRTSHLARLASGSACRSVYPNVAAWGESSSIPETDNRYAISLPNIHPIYENFHDDILIISKEEKPVSSSVGHSLMNGNVFAEARYKQARVNVSKVNSALQTGAVDDLGKVIEEEALSLHALMMCSDPGFILMKPNTLDMISRIRQFRKSSGLPVYFTLDAGPNIHLLYPDSCKAEIQQFIQKELIALCEDGKVIHDHVGNGPTEIDNFSL